MKQTTLRDTVRFAGIGLHTGADVSVELRPAPPNFGLQFLAGGVRIPALAENVVDTSRATVVGRGGTSISTVEHLLSALVGMNVTNAELAVNGPEIPVVDGSAQAFSDAIFDVGVEEQAAPRAIFEIAAPFELRERDSALILLPSRTTRVRFLADFPAPVGVQYFDAEMNAELYRREIAPARTFGYLHEVESLRARGLARGGSLENAIVFAPEGAMQELRWPNEVVRHKTLDLLGDVALLGAWPKCDLIAIKSGHELHARAMLALRRQSGDALPARSA